MFAAGQNMYTPLEEDARRLSNSVFGRSSFAEDHNGNATWHFHTEPYVWDPNHGRHSFFGTQHVNFIYDPNGGVGGAR